MRKVLMVIVGLVALLFAAAVIIPLVVDVDKYRPEIVQAANEKINGKLELGKLKLSLWGQVRVEVGGLSVTDAAGQKVVSVNDAYFHIPFTSLLSGSPELTFKMDHPTINVVKNKAGRLNVMSLMKEASTAPQGVPSGMAKAEAQPSKPVVLPAIATRARLGIELLNALVSYKDQATGLTADIKDLNFTAKDISLSRSTDIQLWADLDTKLGKTFLVKGPMRLTGKATPSVKNGKFEQVALSAKLDMDNVEMASPWVFDKKQGVATNVDLAVIASTQEVKIEHLNAKFFNAEITSSGVMTNTGPTGSPVLNYTAKSNAIELKPWVELVPMLKDFDLGGNVQLDAAANGPTDKLAYRAKLVLNALTAKAPKLKAQPRIDGVVNVVTDQIENLSLTMKAPGNDLQIKGKVLSFLTPRIDLDVTSNGMDLDQLVQWPPKAQKPPKAEVAQGKPEVAAGKATGTPASDFDALLDPLRENKIARATTAAIRVNVKSLKAYDVKMTDIVGKLSLRDLAASIDQFKMKLWGGTIVANGSSALLPKAPTYKFSTQVRALDLSEAVASQFALFKNTLIGKANFDMAGDGASFNPDQAIANLKAKGSMKVENATFATIDVTKMVGEGLGKSVEKVADKVPALKGKKLALPNKESKYEVVSSDFTIANSKFTAPNFVAKAAPNQGIDLKGAVTVGLKDYSLDTTWEIIDTYNLTHAKDLSIEQNGVRVDHILAEGNGPVRFPVHAGCTVLAPCYSYTEVPEFLGKIALANVSSALTGKAKAELRKKAEGLIPKSAPPAIQQKLQDLGKKLFGH